MSKADKKPKVHSVRGMSPIGTASFPALVEPRKINEGDPNEEAKYRLSVVFMPTEFNDPQKKAFGGMIDDVNEACREELFKFFTDSTDENDPMHGHDKTAAFEAALEEHKDTPLKAHFLAFKCLTFWDKKDSMWRTPRSPFLLGKNDDYVDNEAVFIRLSGKGDRPAPGVVGADPKVKIAASEIYAGCPIRVSYNAYPYNNLGNIGVTMYIGNVQKCGDGERIGGGPKAEDEFDNVEAEEPKDVAF